MKVAAIRKFSKSIFKCFGSGMLFLLLVMVTSQCLILTDQGARQLTLLGRLEGVSLDDDSQALLVGDLQTEARYLRLHLAENMTEPQVIRILLDHRLIDIIDERDQSIAIQKGQLLELDCSQLTADMTITLTTSDQAEKQSKTILLNHGKINGIDWEVMLFNEK